MPSLLLATAPGNEALDPLETAAAALETQAEVLRVQAAALRAMRVVSSTPIAATAETLKTRQQAAAAFGVSLATWDRECASGAIPYLVVGDSRRFDLQQVRAALQARTEAPAPRALPALDAAPVPSGVRRVSVGGRRTVSK